MSIHNHQRLNIDTDDIFDEDGNVIERKRTAFEQFMYRHFGMEAPGAVTHTEWKAWRKMAKKKYPIIYWLKEELPYKTWKPVWWRIEHAYWWVQHRINPSRRYHVVKPRTLEPGYHDECHLILHASMHILVEFVEHQKTHEIVDWEATTEHSHAWKEMNAIHDWWIAHQTREDRLPPYPERPKDEDGIDDILSICDMARDSEEYIAWKKVADLHQEMEAQWDNEEEEMLIRLAKIRLYMWD